MFTATLFPAKPSTGQTGIKWLPGKYDGSLCVNEAHVFRVSPGNDVLDRSSKSSDSAAKILLEQADIVPRIGEPFRQGC